MSLTLSKAVDAELRSILKHVVASTDVVINEAFVEAVSFNGFNPVHTMNLVFKKIHDTIEADTTITEKADAKSKILYQAVAIGLIRGNLTAKGFENTSQAGKAIITKIVSHTGAVYNTGAGRKEKDVVNFGRIVAAFPSVAMKLMHEGIIKPKHYMGDDADTEGLPALLCFPGAISCLPPRVKLTVTPAYSYFHYAFRQTTDPKNRKKINVRSVASEVANISSSKLISVTEADCISWGICAKDAKGDVVLTTTYATANQKWTELKTKRKAATVAASGDDE